MYWISGINPEPLGNVEPAPEEFHHAKIEGTALPERSISLVPFDTTRALPRPNPYSANEIEPVVEYLVHESICNVSDLMAELEAVKKALDDGKIVKFLDLYSADFDTVQRQITSFCIKTNPEFQKKL